MSRDWEGLVLEEVDAQLGRLVARSTSCSPATTR